MCMLAEHCGCSSMVEHQLPKLNTRVRFPSSALRAKPQVTQCLLWTWGFTMSADRLSLDNLTARNAVARMAGVASRE